VARLRALALSKIEARPGSRIADIAVKIGREAIATTPAKSQLPALDFAQLDHKANSITGNDRRPSATGRPP
jgi:hypothetical protein